MTFRDKQETFFDYLTMRNYPGTPLLTARG